jgi:hypothetical protein
VLKVDFSSLPSVSRDDIPLRLVDATAFDYQEMADMAREWYPELKDRFILGKPGKYVYQDPGLYTVSNEKSKRVLGIKCKSSRMGAC